jgi:hypothetical protein
MERVVARIPGPFRARPHDLEVGGVLSERRLRQRRIAVEQSAAVVWGKEPFVWIDDVRVRQFQARKDVTDRGGEERRPTVSTVDVVPEPVVPRCLTDAGEVVHDPPVGGPGRGYDGDDLVGRRIGGERFSDSSACQPMIIGRDDHRIESGYSKRQCHRRVSFAAEGDAPSCGG